MLRGPEPVRVISAVAFICWRRPCYSGNGKIDAHHLPWQTLTAFFRARDGVVAIHYGLQKFMAKADDAAENQLCGESELR